MKKLSLAIILITLFISPIDTIGQGSSKLKLGLKVAPNIGWMNPGTKGYTNDGARMGATIGFVSDFYFAENYAFSTGFNFQFLNGKLRYTDSLQVEGVSGYRTGEVFRKYNFLYLEIPLMVKMQTKKFGKMSYFGQMGLGTGFRIKTTVTDNVEFTSGGGADQQFDYTEATLIKESIIVGLGAEYHIDESSRLLFGISYSNALNNILTGTNTKTGLDEKSVLNFVELNLGFLF
jgi:hypothetical protein